MDVHEMSVDLNMKASNVFWLKALMEWNGPREEMSSVAVRMCTGMTAFHKDGAYSLSFKIWDTVYYLTKPFIAEEYTLEIKLEAVKSDCFNVVHLYIR